MEVGERGGMRRNGREGRKGRKIISQKYPHIL